MTLSLPAIQIATLVVTALLYGCFLTLYVVALIATVYIPHKQRQSPRSSILRQIWSPPILASLALLVTVTGHFITLVYRAYQAFILFQGGTAPATFYNDLTQYTERVINSFTVVNFLIWDAVLIYRLWIVWGKVYWILILPGCTYIGHAFAGVEVIYHLAQSGNGQTFYYTDIAPWLKSYAALTCATNIYCTALITWRIWDHDRKMKKLLKTRTAATGALGIFIESALAYAVWNIFYILIYVFQSPMEFFAFNVWVPITGISFLLILIRVGMGYSFDPSGTQPTGTTLAFPSRSQVRSGDSDMERSNIKDEINLDQISVR